MAVIGSWEDVYYSITKCRYNDVVWKKVSHNESVTNPVAKLTPFLGSNDQDDLTIKIEIVDLYKRSFPAYINIPRSFPAEFAEQLLQLHGYPPAWWIGLFASYIMRPNTKMAAKLKRDSQHIINGEPIVGVHVRRTDKLNREAELHSLDEYMHWVDHYFEILRIRQGKSTMQKRCYLASDDPAVFKTATENYPEYEFYADEAVMEIAASERTRYTDESLYGIIKDVTLLSHTDYLVCTFSSQVCRLAYELMQMRGDYGDRFHSLDDIFYSGGQSSHIVEVIQEHKPIDDQEQTVAKGEELRLLGNHWDGYSRALRSNIDVLIPSYKIREKWRIVAYPTYPEVTM